VRISSAVRNRIPCWLPNLRVSHDRRGRCERPPGGARRRARRHRARPISRGRSGGRRPSSSAGCGQRTGGYLIVCWSLACGEEAEPVRLELARLRLAAVTALRERFDRALQESDLPAEMDCWTLAVHRRGPERPCGSGGQRSDRERVAARLGGGNANMALLSHRRVCRLRALTSRRRRFGDIHVTSTEALDGRLARFGRIDRSRERSPCARRSARG
jgi:hypothetical protein